MKGLIRVFVLIAAVFSGQARSETYLDLTNFDGTNLYLGCKAFMNPSKASDTRTIYAMAFCISAIESTYFYGSISGICYPQNVTVGQEAAMIVDYLGRHPDIWNEDGAKVAHDAMRSFWGCK